MKVPSEVFYFADEYIMSFIGFKDFVLQCAFDGVGSACVSKLLKAVNEARRETLDTEGSILDIRS